jgi:hypothetical protein
LREDDNHVPHTSISSTHDAAINSHASRPESTGGSNAMSRPCSSDGDPGAVSSAGVAGTDSACQWGARAALALSSCGEGPWLSRFEGPARMAGGMLTRSASSRGAAMARKGGGCL